MKNNSIQTQFESVFSIAKKQKASKEAGVEFSNVLVNQKAKLEAFVAPNEIQNQINNSLDIDIISAASQIANFTKSNFNTTYENSDIAYGYKVENGGFMGTDFNRAAGLPNDFKIHKKTLDEIVTFNEKNFFNKRSRDEKVFSNIDVADTIKQWYRIFNEVTSGITSKKNIFNETDLLGLPKGYSFTSNAEIMPISDKSKHKITNVYNSTEQLDEAKEISNKLSGLGIEFIVSKLNLSKEYLDSQRDGIVRFNPDMSYYKTDDGYTKEGVFIGFLKNVNAKASLSGKTELKAGALAYALGNISTFKYQSLDDLRKIEQDENALVQMLKDRSKNLITDTLLNNNNNTNNYSELVKRIDKLMNETAV